MKEIIDKLFSDNQNCQHKPLTLSEIKKILILKSIIYIARPDGVHYHLTKDCCMLKGNQFEMFGYKYITWNEIVERKLIPCPCVFDVLNEMNEGIK